MEVTFLRKENQITLSDISGWWWWKHTKKEKFIEFDAVTVYFIFFNKKLLHVCVTQQFSTFSSMAHIN